MRKLLSDSKKLMRIFLLLTLSPLILVGAGLVLFSFYSVRQEFSLRRQMEADRIEGDVRDHVRAWKDVLRVAGTALGLVADDTGKRRAFMARLLYHYPDIQSVRLFSDAGWETDAVFRPGTIRSPEVSIEKASLRSLIDQKEIYQGPVRFPEAGFPCLPLATSVLLPTGERMGILFMTFSLESLSDRLRAVQRGNRHEDIQLREGHNTLAASEPLLLFKGALSSRRFSPLYERGIPELGWVLEIRESWFQTYRATLLLLGQILLALFLVGLLTMILGLLWSRRAHRRIAQEERLVAIGQMINVFGHEIRTALAVIRNSMSFLKEHLGSLDVKTQRHMDIIEDQVVATNKIFAELSGFARSKTLCRKPLAVSAVLDDVLKTLPMPHSIRVERRFLDRDVVVSLDEDEFRKAMTNVILNSIQAMEKGGTLIVGTFRRGSQVIISVTDTGSGIAPFIRPKIFDPFVTTKSQGTGLGLAIVKKFVDEHGGQIQVESRVGYGTTVQMFFQAEILPSQAPAVSTKKAVTA